jgi:hypothetical protein
VNGSTSSDKYGKDDRIFIICLSGDISVEPATDTAIDKSAPFDLAERLIPIQVRLGEINTKRVVSSGTMDVFLAMVPKNANASEITVLKDIDTLGGKILDHKAMTVPPGYLAARLNAP